MAAKILVVIFISINFLSADRSVVAMSSTLGALIVLAVVAAAAAPPSGTLLERQHEPQNLDKLKRYLTHQLAYLDHLDKDLKEQLTSPKQQPGLMFYSAWKYGSPEPEMVWYHLFDRTDKLSVPHTHSCPPPTAAARTQLPHTQLPRTLLHATAAVGPRSLTAARGR